MATIAEFVEMRKHIETLAAEIARSIKNNTKEDSVRNLDEAKRNLEVLKTMVANDVQVTVVSRLSVHLANLEARIGAMKVGSRIRKRPVSEKASAPAKPHIDEPPQIVVFERS